jgi:two-component system, cell cycle sensor histidine kinase and response regulator CckA
VQATLDAGGIACAAICVQNRDDFVAALEHGGIDLILSDFTLPAFDGLSALKIAQAGWPDLPVIMVSGTLGEEKAIDALKSGATDYVLKERLARLAPAVRRAMLEVETRAENKRLVGQFIEAQKMETIGQLASGVAHDFNNILAVIMGNNELLRSELGPDSPLREYAEEIRHASERAAGLTQQLLIFSRKQTVQPVVLDLNDTLKGLDKMLRRLIGENISMTIIPGKQTGRVKADSGHVGQVLMNLVVNARDAMPNGGRLTIATNNVTLDENYPPCGASGGTSPEQVHPVRLPPLTHGAGSSTPQGKRTHTGAMPGDYVMLSVSDTGTGLTEEVKAHLFQAFFTTKPLGKGTGLGLATCQTIVQQSGGHIGIYSEVGRGTTFKVYFPRVEQPLDAAARPIQTGPLPRGMETLLVVEDEPSLMHLTRRALEAQGYEVLSASNGQDALRVVREHKGAPIRLVVTDVIMPLMGGKAMAEWLKTTHPGIKVLFTSGYTDEAIAHHGMLDTGVEFLSKPYTSATLARKVREVLDQPNRPKPDPAQKTFGFTNLSDETKTPGN